MASQHRSNLKSQPIPFVLSSRAPEPSISSSHPSACHDSLESSQTTFKQRIRSSLEHGLKTATRSKAKGPPPDDDLETISARRKDKDKADDIGTMDLDNDKGKSGMFKRFESKVGLRRAGRNSITPSSTPTVSPANQSRVGTEHVNNAERHGQHRVAGWTSFITPSLRQASASSPAVHLSSHPIPPSNLQPVVIVYPTSNPASSSTARDRTRRATMQSTIREISAPQPLAPRREHRSGLGSPERNGTASPRAGKSRPSPIFTPPPSSARSSIDTPRKSSDLPSPPDSPSPQPGGRGRFGTVAKRPGATSATHLPLNSLPSSPTPSRATSPGQARTPTRRVTPTSHQGFVSASATHRPSTSPTANNRLSGDTPRPSLESATRASVVNSRGSSAELAHRPSTEAPGRSSMDTQWRLTASPSPRPTSPSSTTRSRAASPTQRLPGYVHNRNFNISVASLSSPSTPEQRELVRTATSLLCNELRKPPPHLSRSERAREWAEVEVRLQPLVRLERIWGKSGALPGASSSQIGVGLGSLVVSNAGEERERRLFCEALRDGVVLCQLMNKHVPSVIVRIDPREDGFKRTSNITKFLAACSSHGVPSDDLFYRDDLIEATPETLCRVATTIISFLKLFDTPTVDRTKVLSGQGNKAAADMASDDTLYSPPSLSRAASSTPNLAQRRSVSPPPAPGWKYLAPPEPVLPPLRSDSPQSGTSCGTARNVSTPVGKSGLENDDVPSIKMIASTPKSPLRTRSKLKHSDDGGGVPPPDPSSLDFPTRESQSSSPTLGDYGHDFPLRQSRTSSNITENTTYSSIFDLRRNSSAQNKFGTIRTVTTEATSLGSEVPSFTRTEASSVAASVAEEMARRRNTSTDGSRTRDRRPSEPATPDLVSLVEEEENSACGSSSRETARARSPVDDGQRDREPDQVRVRLGKGKWPDDFLDAFQASPPRSIPIQTKNNRTESPLGFSSSSASPSRKPYLVGVSRPNDSTESIPPSPRRASHRARHSVDPVLMPKESILRRDTSPDSPIPSSPGSKVILRRPSTRNGVRRNGIYVPRGNLDDPDREGSSVAVPFPRAVSGEHSTRASPSPDSPQSPINHLDGSRIRGRLYSEFDDPKARQRSRPNSYDELGRQRHSSDLPGRESMDGGAARQTIVIEEEGKAAIRFQLGNCIGRGQFGIVYRALNLTTGQMVAVKRIRLEGLREEEVMQLMNEVDLMKSLSHPGIVKYEGMVRDEEFLNIILEYAESGSLGQTLRAFGKLNEHLVAGYVVKILEGLHYLHKCQVVHCDLKAANILSTKTGNIKLSDFGVSLNLRAMEREHNVAGTPNWMAPEVIELKGASPKSDIWSLGCTVIELLTGRPPYGEIANSMTVMFRIVEDEMPPLPDECSEALQDFLQQCFYKDPLQRPDAERLCEHPWLKMNWDALKELRPQDSIPFLRRVSADLQKTDVAKVLARIDAPIKEAPLSEPPAEEEPSVPQQSVSFGPISPLPDDTPFSPRNHTFVKTMFGKPIICRVCLGSVKKNAVICDRCSLIAHAKCAPDAAPTCELRSQLLLYAQFAEKGNSNVFQPSRDGANSPANTSTVVPSEVSFVTASSRPGADLTSSTPSSGQSLPPKPPAAFKIISGFGRSRSSLSVAHPSAFPSPIPAASADDKAAERKSSKLKHNMNSDERPLSESSNSTGAKSFKTMDSQSSRQEPRRSFFSITEPDTDSLPRTSQRPSAGASSSKITSNGGSVFERVEQYVSGTTAGDSDRQKKRNSEKQTTCVLQ